MDCQYISIDNRVDARHSRIMNTKTQQLQIRVTAEQKRTIRRQAERAGQDLSTYVLARVLPDASARFSEILEGLEEPGARRFRLAALNDLLADLAPAEFRVVLAQAELARLPPFLQNYVAAMVEQAARQKNVAPPDWTRSVDPLDEPYFAAPFASLRPHLLRAAPVAFKRRNLFVDSGVGDRV